jgi:pyridoxal phosphate enzyme (YggS family)
MIRENVAKILEELPEGVELVAAAKTRRPEEIKEAVDAGIKLVGENYVQEAEKAFAAVGRRAKWHFIGHLQKNKVKKAVEIFDLIETVDSFELAEEINRRSAEINKIMPVLIEVNSGGEKQKFGVLPEEVEALARKISLLEKVRIQGLMTMGPLAGKPDDFRPYFAETKKVFEKIKALNIPQVEMKYLSMGMSASYKVAIEEGANVIRIGAKIFGERPL